MNGTPGTDKLPPTSILWPALQVGAFTGSSGLILGGISGLFRSSTPALFAVASGMQWFVLGSTFWATRSVVLEAWGGVHVMPPERIYVSGMAGGLAGGCVGLLMRGHKNILPGLLMFSIFGTVGQGIYNSLDARHSDISRTGTGAKGFWKSFADSKWTPMKVLSDEEYELMLKERLLRVNAEIAIIDDNIQSITR